MVTNAVKKCFFEHLVQNALEDSDEIQNTVVAKVKINQLIWNWKNDK